MNRLYKKNELLFSLINIVIYVVAFSIADGASAASGVQKAVTAPVAVLFSLILFLWIRKNGLLKKYGLCKSQIPMKRMLFYLPLTVIVLMNIIFGVKMNFSPLETFLYIISMLCVGFLEEIIFRGFLFKAMAKDNVKSAILVSGVTFGLGHIVKLINGSGADVKSTLLQAVYAVFIGILFTVIFYRTGSLLMCIATHSLFNALSVFYDEGVITPGKELITAVILITVPLLYTVYVWNIKTEQK